jgi:hypothetical protein
MTIREFLNLSPEDVAFTLLVVLSLVAFAIWREVREYNYRKSLTPEQRERYFDELRNEQHPF